MNQFLNCIWWILNLKWSCMIQQYLFKDEVDQRAFFLPNLSNILVIGTDKRVWQLQKYDIWSNFPEWLAKCSNFPIKKIKKQRRFCMKQLLNFIWWLLNLKWSCKIQQYLFEDEVDQRAFFLPNLSNILVIGTDTRVWQLQKCDIWSNFHEGLGKCSNFPIKK